MFNILALNNISGSAKNVLTDSSYTLHTEYADPDAVLLRSFVMPEDMLTPNVKAIARAGAGVNNIPVEACSEKGIVVFNTPGANANAVKELVIAGLLMSSRKIVNGINWASSLKGTTGVAKAVEKGKSQFVGPEILGKKLGVIGLGAIGVLVANAAKSLGMEVFGYDPYISVNAAWSLSRSVNRAQSLEELLADSDYISLHIPLVKDTKNMFDSNAFASVKKGARLLNFSRAELVDPQALKDALESEQISTYVTDFPTDEILELNNVIAIPHLGASTPESEENCASMASSELKDFLELGNIKNSVNYPDCEIPYTGKTRVCIAHKNLPSLIGQITNTMGTHQINIDNMLNKSKNAWAYTLIDIDGACDSGLTDKLKEIDGVVSVRVI